MVERLEPRRRRLPDRGQQCHLPNTTSISPRRASIEYVILDEGWAVNLQADLMQVVRRSTLRELVEYGAARNVGIWAGYYALRPRHGARLPPLRRDGRQGLQVDDFMDRDDQQMTAFNHRAAATAAKVPAA